MRRKETDRLRFAEASQSRSEEGEKSVGCHGPPDRRPQVCQRIVPSWSVSLADRRRPPTGDASLPQPAHMASQASDVML
ncbi:hypothetical protein BC831DRAFT_447194 [Entophlyctis helioformis]|nr:hypothetical protein BC831DRAFT_447194 [Entophlyctis helioformis]